jgi:hypothetical protein
MRDPIAWAPLLERAAAIVRSYDTGVTLRQLFYRLVALALLPNTLMRYRQLSHYTAEARRQGTFPRLIDPTRWIRRPEHFLSPASAMRVLAQTYRLDRTRGQAVSIYLGIEKAGIIEQLVEWFSDPLGIPVIPFGGYAGQSFVDDVIDDVRDQDRAAVLLYAGDFDATGEDIDRDFLLRSDCWKHVVRVALTPEQVDRYHLPEMPGKDTDPRAGDFIARHGRLVQVELDALDPTDLRALFEEAIADLMDMYIVRRVMAREARDRRRLGRLAEEEGRR